MRTKVYNSPMRDFATFANAMNRAFGADFGNYDFARNGGNTGNGHTGNGHTGNGQSQSQSESTKMRLPVDIWMQDDVFVITAYVPGINPEAVEITMEGEELTIRGNFPALPSTEVTPAAAVVEGEEGEAQETKGPEFIKRELFRGAFERRMTINVPVDLDNIEATYENGLLTLHVPKTEAVRPKQIKVVVK